MNRLFFRPEQCGMTKTDAAAETLSKCMLACLLPWVHSVGRTKGGSLLCGRSSHEQLE